MKLESGPPQRTGGRHPLGYSGFFAHKESWHRDVDGMAAAPLAYLILHGGIT